MVNYELIELRLLLGAMISCVARELENESDGDRRKAAILQKIFFALSAFFFFALTPQAPLRRQWRPIGSDGLLQDYPKGVDSRYPYVQTHSYPERFVDDPYENSVLWSRAFLEFGAGLRKEPPRMIGDGYMGGVSHSIHR